MSFLNIFLRANLWFVIFATDNLLMQKRFDNIKLLVVLHSPNSPHLEVKVHDSFLIW